MAAVPILLYRSFYLSWWLTLPFFHFGLWWVLHVCIILGICLVQRIADVCIVRFNNISSCVLLCWIVVFGIPGISFFKGILMLMHQGLICNLFLYHYLSLSFNYLPQTQFFFPLNCMHRIGVILLCSVKEVMCLLTVMDFWSPL